MGSSVTTFNKTTTNSNKCIRGLSRTRAKRNLGPKNYALWGGGSATIVSPTEESNGDIILAELQCVPSVVSSSVMDVNKVKIVNNRRKQEEDLMDPEEEEKRRLRRDRNRLAAAKCRKRRLDQIETLQLEVDGWEKRNKKLEDEIAALKAEKDEMAFLLAAHKSSCKLQNNFGNLPVKVEPAMEESQVYVQVVPAPLMDTTNMMDTSSSTITATTSPQVTSPKPKRPASLSIPSISTKNIEGIPIDTPSNANLNTPTCGSQQRSIIFTPLFSP